VAFVAAVLLAGDTDPGSGEPLARTNWGGKTLLEHAIELLFDAEGVDEVVAVLAPGDEASATTADDLGARVVRLTEAGRSRSDAIREGVRATSGFATLYLFHEIVHPLVQRDDLELLVRRTLEGNKSIAALYHRGERGRPMIFSALFKGELENLIGDEELETLLSRYPDRLMPVKTDGPGAIESLRTRDEIARRAPQD